MSIKILDKINAEETAKTAEKKFPEFRTGDIVRVSIKIKEGDKFRIQDFEKLSIAGAARIRRHDTVRGVVRATRAAHSDFYHFRSSLSW